MQRGQNGQNRRGERNKYSESKALRKISCSTIAIACTSFTAPSVVDDFQTFFTQQKKRLR